MTDEPKDLRIGDWRLNVRDAVGAGPHSAIFLMHGWTGDERSMWVFASRLPKEALLIAPRAPYPSISDEYGGYSWVRQRSSSLSVMQDFSAAQTEFNTLLSELSATREEDFSSFSLIGFSQGAAFCYAYALNQPERVQKLAGLSGFLPQGSQTLVEARPLQGKSLYIAHGSRDETVPVAHAHNARQLLQLAGAEVSYCESDSAHKLGTECFRGLAEFFA